VLGGPLLEIWRARGQPFARAIGLALAAVVTRLVLAFGVSVVRTPIYVVARYDVISWGAYYLLAGAVPSRLPVVVAGPAILVWIALSCATLVPHFTTTRLRLLYANYGDVIAPNLRANGHTADLVIFTASRRPATEYYLRGAADRFRLVSYPLGTDDHPGWIDARIATDQELAVSEAQRFTAWMTSAPPVPEVVWVVGPRTQGTPQLIDALARLGYRRDGERSNPHLLCLRRA